MALVQNYSYLSYKWSIPCPLFLITACNGFGYLSTRILQISKIPQISRFLIFNLSFQFVPQVFDMIQVGTLARPFQNINLIILKPFLDYFGSMFWVIILLKDPVWSEILFLRILSNIFWSISKYCSFFMIPFILTKLPAPLAKKEPQKH